MTAFKDIIGAPRADFLPGNEYMMFVYLDNTQTGNRHYLMLESPALVCFVELFANKRFCNSFYFFFP